MNQHIIFLAAALAFPLAAAAQNPIVQTCHTTDPAPMVDGDRLYVYTGHDEDGADFFWMNEWRAYSTTDMVNWTDHGTVADLGTFEWADDRAWAPQCVRHGDKYYLYVPAHSKLTNAMAIGVCVADSPTGPFHDPIGRPLADGSWDYIDPTVLIEDNGRAWLAWGNPRIYYAELNEDMISFKSEVKRMPLTVEGFGAPDMKERNKDTKYIDMYTEGPWLMRRGKLYYLIYAAGGVPEHIAYSTAKNVEGPWTYRGTVMPEGGTNSFTNHSGMADFKGHSYFFYHTGKLPDGGGFGRSVAVEEFKFDKDGSIPNIYPTDEGVAPIGTLSPYERVEAETMATSRGVHTEQDCEAGVFLTDLHNGDWTRLRCVDFGSESPQTVEMSLSSMRAAGAIELRADSVEGAFIATVQIPNTGGWERWTTVSAKTEQITGLHDVFLVMKGWKGNKLCNINWWRMKRD